jgi:hypothetical protein
MVHGAEQMKSDELMAQMSEALKSNTYVRDLILVNCNVGLKGCEFLAEAVSSTRACLQAL